MPSCFTLKNSFLLNSYSFQLLALLQYSLSQVIGLALHLSLSSLSSPEDATSQHVLVKELRLELNP